MKEFKLYEEDPNSNRKKLIGSGIVSFSEGLVNVFSDTFKLDKHAGYIKLINHENLGDSIIINKDIVTLANKILPDAEIVYGGQGYTSPSPKAEPEPEPDQPDPMMMVEPDLEEVEA